jgi:hypothetical protein
MNKVTNCGHIGRYLISLTMHIRLQMLFTRQRVADKRLAQIAIIAHDGHNKLHTLYGHDTRFVHAATGTTAA